MTKKQIDRSLAIQDKHILQLRAEKCSVLNDIRHFRAEDPPSPYLLSNHSSSEKSLYVIYDTEYTAYLHSTMDKVKGLLDRVEILSELYPTMNAMRKAIAPEDGKASGGLPMMDVNVQLKISSLYMWYNTVQDLLMKINEVQFLGNEQQFMQ